MDDETDSRKQRCWMSARAHFPRGLVQPADSFRFAADALLLACFMETHAEARLLDLGTGCGVVALALLCRHENCTAFGIEVQPQLVAAARANAERLGLRERFTVLCRNLGDPSLFGRNTDERSAPARTHAETISPETFDFVFANPPYHSPERGRVSPKASRRTALFENPDTLHAFCRAAWLALAPDGRFAILFPARRCGELLDTLRTTGLRPVRILPLQTLAHKAPGLVLVESRKSFPGDAFPPPAHLAPLILHRGAGKNTRLTPEALAFCPFLACNPGSCPD